jgi:hypothetical protein
MKIIIDRYFSDAPPNNLEEEWDECEWFDMNRNTESRQHNKAEVRRVRQALNSAMGLQLKVNGVMGSQMRSAIRSFQARQDLPVDSIVGTQTEHALNAMSAGTLRDKETEFELDKESSGSWRMRPPEIKSSLPHCWAAALSSWSQRTSIFHA